MIYRGGRPWLTHDPDCSRTKGPLRDYRLARVFSVYATQP